MGLTCFSEFETPWFHSILTNLFENQVLKKVIECILIADLFNNCRSNFVKKIKMKSQTS